jgi:ribosomal protein L19
MLWQQQYVEPYVKEINNTKVNDVKKQKTKKKDKKKTFRFKIGDKVRISHLRSLFQREYDQKWTGEVFTVTKRWSREGIYVYELDDYGGDPVEGTFYEQELQTVTFDADQPFKIEKVLKTRGRGTNKEHYVKWLSWPNKYNSWINDYVPL